MTVPASGGPISDERLSARLERHADLLGCYTDTDDVVEALLEAAALLSKQEAALRFYADEEKYKWSPGPPRKRGVIQAEDRGATARAALEGTQE